MAVDKGWVCDLRVHTGTDMAGVSDMEWSDWSLDYDNKLKQIFVGGKRTVEEIVESVIGIKFKMSQPYQGSTISGYAGVGSTGALTTYYIGIWPDGYGASSFPYYRLKLFIGKYTLGTSAEGYLEETIDCEVESVTRVDS